MIFTFQDTGEIFDPTTSDGCGPANESVMTLILNSPLIGEPNRTINGVNVGVAQYVDGFQRANFWAKVGGTPYHTMFSTSPTVLPAVSVSVPAANGVTVSALNFAGCRDTAELDQTWWDNELQTVVMPQLAAEGVGPANFPQFIFNSVAQYIGGNPANCCALGYHNSYSNGGVFQTYSVNEYDTSGAFGGDTSVMSHEIGNGWTIQTDRMPFRRGAQKARCLRDRARAIWKSVIRSARASRRPRCRSRLPTRARE